MQMTIRQVSSDTAPPSRAGFLTQLSRLRQLRPLATLAVVVLHMLVAHADYSQVEALAAGVCGAVTLNVCWSYFARRARGLPVLAWVSFQLYVFFAMPVFFEGLPVKLTSFQTLSQNGAVLKAFLAANLFLISLLGGWRLLWKHRFKARNHISPYIAPMSVMTYGVISLAVSFFLRKYELEIKLDWYTTILNLLFSPTLAQILLLFELQRDPKNKSIMNMMWVFTGFSVFQGIFSSRLDYALVPLVIAGIGLLGGGQRIPKWLIVGALSLLLVFNPAKHIYRELTGYRTTQFSTVSFGEMVNAWKYSIQQVWAGDAGTDERPNQRVSSRLNNLTINAMVIDDVPGMVHFAYGKPWLAVPYSLVPRFFWPGKPNLTEMTKDLFNVTFGMTTWQIAERSTGAHPIIADAFWNFGWAGVILVGLIAGYYWKVVYLVWSPATRVRYALPFLILIHTRAASALPSLFIGVLQTTIVCIVVVKGLEFATTLFRKRTQ